MSWIDTLPTIADVPALFPAEPGETEKRIGFHVRRAGLGTFAAVYLRDPAADARYAAFRSWKADPAGQGDFLDAAAVAIVGMVRQWSAVLPADWIVTTPPQGASQGGTYPAGILARQVATRLDLDYQTTMQRTKAKRFHHPQESRRQEPFAVTVAPPAVALVVDDFISSGTTIRLAREALAAGDRSVVRFRMGGGMTIKTNEPAQWSESLPCLDLDGMRPVFEELAGHENDAAREWVGDRRHVRRTDRSVMLDARRLKNAMQHIGRLPEPDEAFHLVTRGAYSLWHVVKAVLQFAAPATIAYLGVATLGFSRTNLEELLEAIDSGAIGKVDFLYSVYFASNEKEICQRLAHELAQRGQRVVACLQHAKVLLIELTDGRTFVAESSANLRSCASIENITIIHDRALFDFHRAWLDDVLSGGSK